MNRKKLIPAALLALPVALAGLRGTSADALEKKSIYNLKLFIFNNGQYDSSYDLNGNGKSDVFDIIRIKQHQYSTGSRTIVNSPVAVTTTAETSSPAVSLTELSGSVTDGSVTTAAVTETTGEETSGPAVTTVPADTLTSPAETSPVSETSPEETTTVPETTASVTEQASAAVTTAETTTEAPVTTTVTTASVTEAPVTTVVTTVTTPVTTVTTPAAPLPQKKIISSVKSFVQGPELPTGCEATGLTIAIRWYGYNADKVDIAMKYMPRQDFTHSGDRLIGADFRTTFAGDPSRNDMSYGCYIPCMISTVDNYFKAVGSSYRGKDISGRELEELFPYIARRIPVILISTPELITPRPGDAWYTADGRYVQWQRGHHCMVLIGYDKTRSKVYCADPMMRAGIVEYDLGAFKNIYNLKGKNAMIIDTGSVTVPVTTLKPGETVRFAGWVNSQSDGKGSERFLETGVYTISQIHPNTSLPCPVNISGIGWTSYDALYENSPYFGTGTPSPSDNPPSSGDSAVTGGRVYNIVNASSGKYLNVNYGRDTDGANIYQYTNDGTTEQKFKLTADGDAWKIMAMCSSSGNSRMVTASKTADGENVYLWQSVSSVTQQWTIKKIGENRYCIALKAYPGYVLTVSDKSNGTAAGTGSGAAGNVYISKYTGADNQLWSFKEV